MRQMRVCLDISAALGQGAGIGRYSRELALALHKLPDGPELVLFHNRQASGPQALPDELSGLKRLEIPLGNKAWRAFLLADAPLPASWQRGMAQCDLFHGTDALAPHIHQPAVITIHDLSTTLYPQHHTRLHRLFASLALPRFVHRAAAIIADSAATKRDIVEYLHTSPAKVSVVHLGVDHKRFFPCSQTEAQDHVKTTLGIHPPYLLAVGTLEPRKNIPAILRAYASLGTQAPKLVLSGTYGWGDNPITGLISTLDLTKRVILTGYVPDTTLPDLYAGALLFVYPSLYEGFGLPVLEALACGTPVITSNSSSLPEVTGEAALLVNPRHGEELASAMSNLIADEGLRQSLREAAPKQAMQFRWEYTARDTMTVYSSILQRK